MTDDETFHHRGRRRDLVKFTVNLQARVNDSLETICEITGDNRSEVINKAVKFYGLYIEASQRGEKMRLVAEDGTVREIHVL